MSRSGRLERIKCHLCQEDTSVRRDDDLKVCDDCRKWDHFYHLEERLCVPKGGTDCMLCRFVKKSHELSGVNNWYTNTEDLSQNVSSYSPTNARDFKKNERPHGPWNKWTYFWNIHQSRTDPDGTFREFNVKLADYIWVQAGNKESEIPIFNLMRVQYLVQDDKGKYWASAYHLTDEKTVLKQHPYYMDNLHSNPNRIPTTEKAKKNGYQKKFGGIMFAVTTANGWVPLDAVDGLACGLDPAQLNGGRPISQQKTNVFFILYNHEWDPGFKPNNKRTTFLKPDLMYKLCKKYFWIDEPAIPEDQRIWPDDWQEDDDSDDDSDDDGHEYPPPPPKLAEKSRQLAKQQPQFSTSDGKMNRMVQEKSGSKKKPVSSVSAKSLPSVSLQKKGPIIKRTATKAEKEALKAYTKGLEADPTPTKSDLTPVKVVPRPASQQPSSSITSSMQSSNPRSQTARKQSVQMEKVAAMIEAENRKRKQERAASKSSCKPKSKTNRKDKPDGHDEGGHPSPDFPPVFLVRIK